MGIQFCQIKLDLMGRVNRMNGKRNVSQMFDNNPQRSRLRGRPKKTGGWNCVQTDINNCRINNWEWRSKNRADWGKSLKEAKVRVGP